MLKAQIIRLQIKRITPRIATRNCFPQTAIKYKIDFCNFPRKQVFVILDGCNINNNFCNRK